MKFRTLGAVGYLAEGVLLIASAIIFVATYYFTKTTTAQVPSPAATSTFPGLALTAISEAVVLVPLGIVSLAWLYAGREGKSGVLRATGVLGFIMIVAIGSFSLWFFGAVSSFLPSSTPPNTASFPTFFGLFFELAIGAAIVGLLALAYVILEIVTFFSAAGLFRSGRFRWAAWGRITSIVAVVALYFVAIAALISSIVPTGPSFFNSTGSGVPSSPRFASQPSTIFGALFFTIPLVLSVPNFLAFQGFRRVQTEPPPTAAWQAPPAPQP